MLVPCWLSSERLRVRHSSEHIALVALQQIAGVSPRVRQLLLVNYPTRLRRGGRAGCRDSVDSRFNPACGGVEPSQNLAANAFSR